MPRTGVPARASRVGCQHTSRHTSPEMAISRTLAKDRDRHPLKAPCLHLSQNRYFDCQKTKGAGFKPPREAARSFNSREFCFEIWERESAPADYCLIRRLSMDASCPSLPPKILVADKLRPNAQTTAFMAAHGCHFVVCSLYVLLVIIESFFLAVRESLIARTLLYKASIAIVSRSF